MELKRDIYSKLLEWKKKNSHKVLELEGARQIGKTFILDSFSKEYKYYIYINMIGSTGQRFLQCLEAVLNWELGQIPIEKPIHRALELYKPDFADHDDLSVVIDEIQDSPMVYSEISWLYLSHQIGYCSKSIIMADFCICKQFSCQNSKESGGLQSDGEIERNWEKIKY